MKVTNNPAGNAQLIESTRAAEKAKGTDKAAEGGRKAAVASGSEVTISERAQLMNQASEAAKGAPDVRREKVDALKAQILGGTYKIDSETIAERLLQEHLGTDFGKNNL
jgi:negative regulator of flagellin synthesis FlgM